VLAVAHRAGNDLGTLRAAALMGADVIEADVHLHRGRLEVRHTKTLWPLPWLYDAGQLHPADLPRLHLGELLDALPPKQTIMLDLKGVGRAGAEVARAVHARSPEHPLLVCARWWPSVLPFAEAPWAKVLLSVRGRTELGQLWRRLATGTAPYGTSIHLSLLTPEVVRALHAYGLTVLTWPVDDTASLARARELGVDGAISKDLDVLRQVVADRWTQDGPPPRGVTGRLDEQT
jgi:glycerophosphoryl diester phosphodiesterase